MTLRSPNLNRSWLVAALALALFISSAAIAQQPQAPSAQDQLLAYFYKDPRPERLVGFLESFKAEQHQSNAYPAVAGLFTVVFIKHPDQIEKLVPANLTPQGAATIAAALQMSGNAAIAAKLQNKLTESGSDDWLKVEFANLPNRLDDLRIRTPTHLDIFWGAAFASEDTKYVRKIVEYFALNANRSEPVAIDITRTTVAIAGGPKDIFGQLKGKYGDDSSRQIIYAAVALWGLQSNSKQHAFVDNVVARYLTENPGTPATKALSVFRPKRQ